MTLIDFPYVERNTSRHGQVRYYLRIEGRRICRLPDDIDSEEFAAAYWKARNAAGLPVDPKDGSPRTLDVVKAGTFRWLCVAYLRSGEFNRLDTTTQKRRRSIIDSMCLEPLTAKPDERRLFADIPLSSLDVGHMTTLRDRKRDVPFAADERLKVLRQVLDVKDAQGKHLVSNLAKAVKPFRKHSDGHHPITPAEIEQFIRHHGPNSRAVYAIAFLMFTGIRVSDLAAIGPQHRRGDQFHLRLFKNRNRAPVDIVIPIHPTLEDVMSRHPIRGLNYILCEYGRPYSVKGLGNRVSKWFSQAGLEHCTSHSVRKGLATDQAHNEATDSQLDAMFGWKDGKTSKIYTRHAERARLARQAVIKIKWDGVGTHLLTVEG